MEKRSEQTDTRMYEDELEALAGKFATDEYHAGVSGSGISQQYLYSKWKLPWTSLRGNGRKC